VKGDVPRLAAAALVMAVPGLAAQFKKVPPGYCHPHGKRVPMVKVRVHCLCGNRPVLARGEMRACRDRCAMPHRCARYFLWTGKSVLVANGPTS
jgi:hypothetical protein